MIDAPYQKKSISKKMRFKKQSVDFINIHKSKNGINLQNNSGPESVDLPVMLERPRTTFRRRKR